MKKAALLVIILIACNHISNAQFTVTAVPAENGTYKIEPALPAGGKVAPGTVLTVTAMPASGFALDAVYSTFKGGMWGTTSIENFSSPMKITVDKDMSVGAVFIEKALVENL